MRYCLIVLLLLIGTACYADSKILPLDEIPEILSTAQQNRFQQEKLGLERELKRFQDAGNAFNAKSAEAQTDEEFDSLVARQKAYVASATDYNRRLLAAEVARVIDTMTAAVSSTSWSADEKSRAESALKGLVDDGSDATVGDIRRVWQEVLARQGSTDLMRKAAGGKGPGMPGAGNQTYHQDCAVFALANAAGVPYGVAAARAAAFIKDGAWRPAAERVDPGKTIEQRGLMGGEIILVAEAFGQVQIVPSQEFESTLAEGRPVMVNLVPYDGSLGNGHEVVLTRTFSHDGATWFEMIDSNQAGTRQRLYLNKKELLMLLKERGVSIIRDTASMPDLLRTGGSQ